MSDIAYFALKHPWFPLADVRNEIESFCIWGHAAAVGRKVFAQNGCLSKKQLRYRARKERWIKFKKRMGLK